MKKILKENEIYFNDNEMIAYTPFGEYSYGMFKDLGDGTYEFEVEEKVLKELERGC